jgi:uncharacterized radical SAM superfamily protein
MRLIRTCLHSYAVASRTSTAGVYLSGGQQTMMKTPLDFFANELAPSGS